MSDHQTESRKKVLSRKYCFHLNLFFLIEKMAELESSSSDVVQRPNKKQRTEFFRKRRFTVGVDHFTDVIQLWLVFHTTDLHKLLLNVSSKAHHSAEYAILV